MPPPRAAEGFRQRLRRALSVLFGGSSSIDEWLRGSSSWWRPAPAGIAVDAGTALAVGPVYACVRVWAETMASLPVHLYERDPRDERRKRIVRSHPVAWLLRHEPNAQQSSYEWREMLEGHLALRGNAYCLIERDRDGVIVGLWPVHPAEIAPQRDADGTIYYELTTREGVRRRLPPYDVLHLRGLCDDGLLGRGPLQIARDVIAAAKAADDYAARFFANDGTPQGYLKTDQVLGTTPEQSKLIKESIRASWREMTTGENRHTTPVLDRNLQWERVGLDPQTMQMIETRKLAASEIARIFRIPAFLVGVEDKTTTFASAEQQMLAFQIHAIRPEAVRWEHALARALLSRAERERFFIEFNLDALVRGDIRTRYDAYASGRQWGWLSVNDIRALEDLPPIGPAGDVYLQPVNMVPAGAAASDELARTAPSRTNGRRSDDYCRSASMH